MSYRNAVCNSQVVKENKS